MSRLGRKGGRWPFERRVSLSMWNPWASKYLTLTKPLLQSGWWWRSPLKNLKTSDPCLTGEGQGSRCNGAVWWNEGTKASSQRPLGKSLAASCSPAPPAGRDYPLQFNPDKSWKFVTCLEFISLLIATAKPLTLWQVHSSVLSVDREMGPGNSSFASTFPGNWLLATFLSALKHPLHQLPNPR